MSETIAITPARRDDVPEIQRLAHEIWHAHYPGIVTREQIDYMLERGYATGVLDEFIEGPDSGIELAVADGRCVGFAAWYATGTPGEAKLDKLYVLQAYQRQGVGGRLIARVESAAKAAGATTLLLNVNKNNSQAIRAYEKHGFAIRAAVEVDIGHGFVMDDYVMAKPLGGRIAGALPAAMPTPLTLYDNYTRSLREFQPLVPGGDVGVYTCGPTVYDYQHIGNYRTFLFEDVLKRVLEWNGYRVRHVMNVTDVGHLTSDADEGEDKMEKGARRTGKSAWEIARLYTEAFVDDMKALNLESPTILCRATDHIAEQIAFIADIEAKGYTYRTSDGVYFDTSRQADYGYLARLDKTGLEAGKRVDVGEKRDPTDFALWKFSPAGEKRQMEWDSPWGRGFPGWHIECSAMAQKYLGDFFDIHCGGEDHIPVHHTNEIAQTEARVCTRLANFWMHGYFLLANDAKMAKSAGGFLRIATLVERGYDPLAYRYLCLTAHYRTQLNFTWDALDAAATGLERMRSAFFALESDAAAQADADAIERFTGFVNDDLNVPRALALAWETLRGDLPAQEKRVTLARFDDVFGLGLADWKPKLEPVPDEVRALAEQRAAARKSKNWSDADRLRAQLHAIGWEMEDRPDGYALKRR